MPDTNINSAEIGNKLNTQDNYAVTPVDTDGPQDQKETTYTNTAWTTQMGYYISNAKFKTAVNAKARWTVGKGIVSNEITEMALSTIKGNGKDTFNTILENAVRVYHIGGDSFAEIIRDNTGQLLNLKPLNPGKIKIVCNRQGIITRYEQINKPDSNFIRRGFNKVLGRSSGLRFKPDQIFHLMKDRVADEIHGRSIVPAVQKILDAYEEAFADYKLALHRNVYPIRIYHLDTDDSTEIAKFKATADKAGYQGENIYIPKGAVETELAAVPSNATMNPLPWIQLLGAEFYQATGVPMIVAGGGAEFTEASAKIAFIAFEATISEEQLYIMESVLSQLNLEIKLEVPASLQQELLTDMGKEETAQASTPEDTTVPNTGVK